MGLRWGLQPDVLVTVVMAYVIMARFDKEIKQKLLQMDSFREM